MDEIIDDLLKIYLSCIDSYNSKIYQTINSKYTIVDKSMLTIYLFVKIIEDREEKNDEITKVLTNYLLKQVIYSETGNLSFEISDKSKIKIYNDILDKIILEKFEYKNRIMKKLKYNYKNIEINKYSELLFFLEYIVDYAILKKLIVTGNKEATTFLNKCIDEIKLISLDENDYFYKEKKDILNLINNNKFNESVYGNIIGVALKLRDVYRYAQITNRIS